MFADRKGQSDTAADTAASRSAARAEAEASVAAALACRSRPHCAPQISHGDQLGRIAPRHGPEPRRAQIILDRAADQIEARAGARSRILCLNKHRRASDCWCEEKPGHLRAAHCVGPGGRLRSLARSNRQRGTYRQ